MIRSIIVLCLAFSLVKGGVNQGNTEANVGDRGGGGNAPQFVKTTNVTSVHGRSAILQCPFDKSKNFATAWMRRQNQRTILIGRQSQKFIQSNRYSILHKEGVNDLTIFNVTQEDDGDYICQINTEPMKNYLFKLIVMRPPVIIENSPASGRATGEEGSNIELSCSAIGNPIPKIKWKRSDDKKMNIKLRNGETHRRRYFSGNVLTLVDVRKNDTGDVLCIADNGYPPLVSQKFELTINYKPRISIYMDEFRQTYNEGFYKILCRIDAVPLPNQLEMRIGGRLMNPRKEVISDRVVELHFEPSRDFGSDVQCFAANSAGSDALSQIIPHIEYETTTEKKFPKTTELTSSMNYADEEDFYYDVKNRPQKVPKMHQQNRFEEKSTFAWSTASSIRKIVHFCHYISWMIFLLA